MKGFNIKLNQFIYVNEYSNRPVHIVKKKKKSIETESLHSFEVKNELTFDKWCKCYLSDNFMFDSQNFKLPDGNEDAFTFSH